MLSEPNVGDRIESASHFALDRVMPLGTVAARSWRIIQPPATLVRDGKGRSQLRLHLPSNGRLRGLDRC